MKRGRSVGALERWSVGFQLLHQVAQDHLQDGEENAKLDGGGLHAGGAGDGHGTSGEVDFFDEGLFDDLAAALDVLAKNVVRVVIDKIDFGADFDSFPGG